MSLYEKLKGRLASILTPHFLGREQEALVELSLVTVEEATQDVQESIEGLQEQVNDLRSEYGADLVGIEDEGGFFDSFTVEGALQELGAGGGGGGGFNPSLPQTITGKWKFTQPVSLSDNGFEGNLSAPGMTGDRSYALPDKSGTLATLDDVEAAGTIIAGAGISVSKGPTGTTVTNTIPRVNLIPGSNVGITGTYPNITISAAGGSGGGAVNSVNGKVGDVVLSSADVGAAPTEHTHSIGQVTGLSGALDGKAPSVHTHSMSQVTGLEGALDGKAPTVHTHTMNQVTGLEGALNGKAPTVHTHAASAITSGVVATARLGTGTASTDTFLRGDGTWAVPPKGGGGSGTVTSVNVQGSTGLSFTGGPVTTSGTITGTLSTNLQSWSSINPSSKFNKPTGTTGQYIRGDGSLATFPSVGSGTVTSVEVKGGTGLTFTGGPVTSSGTITGSLSSNLQSWSGISPSSKFNTPSGTTAQYIRGNGSLATFPSIPAGTVTSVAGGNGLTGTVTSSGSIALGTPGAITLSSTNSVTTSSHTHAFTPGGTASQYIRGNGTLATFPNIPTSANFVATSGNQTGIAGNKTFTGNITAANLTATSDARLKEDVEEMEARQQLLSALTYYRYKWKDSGDKAVGILAQEVQKVAPEHVFEDEDGTLSVDKAGLALEMVFALIERMDNGSTN